MQCAQRQRDQYREFARDIDANVCEYSTVIHTIALINQREQADLNVWVVINQPHVAFNS